MMSRFLGAACALALGGNVCAAQDLHAPHPAPERLGTVSFPTSCADGVQPGFNRALALLHSFAYAAAEAGFRDVAARDPACAIAHWGLAMSRYHELWEPPAGEDLRVGAEEARSALALKAGSPRERQYIEAIATYYRDAEQQPASARAGRYAQAMAGVARGNTADSEAQIFYALALIATASPTDVAHANQKQAADILEPIYAREPDHPGLAHYLIHAYDSVELAPRGLAAARAYSRIAPSAPHALHMPSHIFTRVGDWDGSIASNTAARAAAHAQGDLGEELHAMDYLTYAYLQRGRYADAAQLVSELRAIPALAADNFKVGYAATAMPVRLAIERRDWAAAAALEPLPRLAPRVAALVYWARALGQARSGEPQRADADIDRLEACYRETRAAGGAYWVAEVDAMLEEARAWRAAAAGKSAIAVAGLRAAADAEDAVEKLPLTPGPVVPAREQLGELLLEQKRPREALAEFQAALALAPRRRGALLGAIAAAQALGKAALVESLRVQLDP